MPKGLPLIIYVGRKKSQPTWQPPKKNISPRTLRRSMTQPLVVRGVLRGIATSVTERSSLQGDKLSRIEALITLPVVVRGVQNWHQRPAK